MIRKLCDKAQLPDEGTLKAFVDPNAIPASALCVGMVAGVPYAIDNACPHQRASLASGRLEGTYVVCPIHGWKFCLQNGRPQRENDPSISSYEMRMYGEEVFVRLPGVREPAV